MQRINSELMFAQIVVEETCEIRVFQTGDLPKAPSDTLIDTISYFKPSITNNFVVDYGDGVKESFTAVTSPHTYEPGNYTIRIFGEGSFKNFYVKPLTTIMSMRVGVNLISGLKGYIKYLRLNSACFKQNYSISDAEIADRLWGYNASTGSLDPTGVTITINSTVRKLDAPNCYYYITADKNFDSNTLIFMPDGNEKWLFDIADLPQNPGGANYGRAYVQKSAMVFNDLDRANALGNLLNGATLDTGTGTSASVTHTYTTNKTISKVLCSTVADRSGITFDKSTKVLTVKNYGSGSSVATDTGLMGLKFIYSDNSYDTDYFRFTNRQYSCFLAGTKITLADGTQKVIEDIKYDDLLLTWDFLSGELKAQFPFFIKERDLASSYLKFTLENNETFNIVGDHGVYDVKNKHLDWITTKNYKDIDLDNFEVWFRDANTGELVPTKIKSIDYIEGEYRDFYTLVTSGTQTCFTNNVLTCGNQFWNLVGQIDENNRFDMTQFNAIKNNPDLQYTYEDFIHDFVPINRDIYYGNLYNIIFGAYVKCHASSGKFSEADIRWHMTEGLNFWELNKPFDTIDGETACYIALKYKNSNIVKQCYKLGSTIDLPSTEKGWYCVYDTNTYASKFKVNVSTVLEEI